MSRMYWSHYTHFDQGQHQHRYQSHQGDSLRTLSRNCWVTDPSRSIGLMHGRPAITQLLTRPLFKLIVAASRLPVSVYQPRRWMPDWRPGDVQLCVSYMGQTGRRPPMSGQGSLSTLATWIPSSVLLLFARLILSSKNWAISHQRVCYLCGYRQKLLILIRINHPTIKGFYPVWLIHLTNDFDKGINYSEYLVGFF